MAVLMDGQDALIVRHPLRERVIHWSVAILFFLAGLSGLALFTPHLFFLSTLFGGGPWTRILHPWLGLAMFALFAALAALEWRHNYLTPDDRQWLRQPGDAFSGRERRLPEAGRYNAGQKVLFWMMVACMVLLLLSGPAIWYQYFAWGLPVWLRRLAADVLAISAFVLIEGIIVHIYASVWVRGSMRGMMRGVVPSAWARYHHPAWYREMTRQQHP